jgi:hypothetical protein
MKRLVIALLTLFAIAQAPPQEPTETISQEPAGTISVQVIDQQGNPVPDATVEMDPPPGRMLLYSSPTCKTDASGACSTDKLPMDTYYIRAKKPSDGYPDVSFSFYSHETRPVIVQLTASQPIISAVFKLGPRAARLILRVVDDISGEPVDNPTVILRSASGPPDFIGMGRDPDSSVLVPPDKDIYIEIRADGYLPWYSKEHSDVIAGNTVRLPSGDQKEFTIRLTRQ